MNTDRLIQNIIDHGGGQGEISQGFQIFTNIFACLLQVKPHGGDLPISGKGKIPNRFFELAADLLCHFYHRGHYNERQGKSQRKTYLKDYIDIY